MNFFKRKICRKLIKDTIKCNQERNLYGLGTIMPDSYLKKLKDMQQPLDIKNSLGASHYGFFYDETTCTYYFINKQNNLILFIGSTNTTDYDNSHTPEEIIEYDCNKYKPMILIISLFIDAQKNKEQETYIINKYGDDFLFMLKGGIMNVKNDRVQIRME